MALVKPLNNRSLDYLNYTIYQAVPQNLLGNETGVPLRAGETIAEMLLWEFFFEILQVKF